MKTPLIILALAVLAARAANAYMFRLDTTDDAAKFALDTTREASRARIDTRANPRAIRDLAEILPISVWGAGMVSRSNGGTVATFSSDGTAAWKPSGGGTWTLVHASDTLRATATFVLPMVYTYRDQSEVDAIAALREPVLDVNGRVPVKAAEAAE